MDITQRQLVFGPHTLTGKGDLGHAPYVIAGPHMYVIGRASGELGGIGDEHIRGEMGGVWAHPLKVAEGIVMILADETSRPVDANDATFEEHLTHVLWCWSSDGIGIERRDAVVPSTSPSLCLQISLHNSNAEARSGELQLQIWLKFVPAWMSGLHSGGGMYHVEGNWLLGRDRAFPDTWGVACGANRPLDGYRLIQRDVGCDATMIYRWSLEPGERRDWLFVLAAESQHGADAAQRAGQTLLGDDAPMLERQASVAIPQGLLIETPDDELNRGIDLAQANLRLLEATYPDLGSYFLAGLPEYPQLFGCDTTYSVPGALASGYINTTKSALEQLASYAARACGRVPHELTTNARIFHPGNIQETPQFVIACWDFVRWTGDLAFARNVYAVCREALDSFLPTISWPDGMYPVGDGMIERLGMGSRKLDSSCYHYAALVALAALCEALNESEQAAIYHERAAHFKEHFTNDWWYEPEGLYADSMHSDNSLQFDGHWTVGLPLQLGLANGERAATMFDRITNGGWINEWGMVHTRNVEDRVWTLPTGLLALAAFQHERGDLGLWLLKRIALTTETGTLGAFKELIPEGLCFIQLWSAGLYLQGVVEGVLGLQPLAHRHELTVAPNMPADWNEVRVRGLLMGDHNLSLLIGRDRLQIEHLDGSQPLTVRFADQETSVAVGQTVELQRAEKE